ncbi:hypothetical protein A9Q91_03095 [Candidatus Gracilibacteria bacterium 28_42_T64]|nr:hypothetical protein A9Q91_03095 [Candidatus Gracilibacteria bacterium 28_42_T64]
MDNKDGDELLKDALELSSYVAEVNVESLCNDIRKLRDESSSAAFEYWHGILTLDSSQSAIISNIEGPDFDNSQISQALMSTVKFSNETEEVLKKLNISPILPSLFNNKHALDKVISAFEEFAPNASLVLKEPLLS